MENFLKHIAKIDTTIPHIRDSLNVLDKALN